MLLYLTPKNKQLSFPSYLQYFFSNHSRSFITLIITDVAIEIVVFICFHELFPVNMLLRYNLYRIYVYILR